MVISGGCGVANYFVVGSAFRSDSEVVVLISLRSFEIAGADRTTDAAAATDVN